jgi:hypothetical protein
VTEDRTKPNWAQKDLGKRKREIGTAHEYFMGGPTNFEDFSGPSRARDKTKAWEGVVQNAWEWAVVMRLEEYSEEERREQFTTHEKGRTLREWWNRLHGQDLPYALQEWAKEGPAFTPYPQGSRYYPRFFDLAFDLHEVNGQSVTLRQKLIDFDLPPPEEI